MALTMCVEGEDAEARRGEPRRAGWSHRPLAPAVAAGASLRRPTFRATCPLFLRRKHRWPTGLRRAQMRPDTRRAGCARVHDRRRPWRRFHRSCARPRSRLPAIRSATPPRRPRCTARGTRCETAGESAHHTRSKWVYGPRARRLEAGGQRGSNTTRLRMLRGPARTSPCLR